MSIFSFKIGDTVIVPSDYRRRILLDTHSASLVMPNHPYKIRRIDEKKKQILINIRGVNYIDYQAFDKIPDPISDLSGLDLKTALKLLDI